jgi:uncharacterized membrane protein
MAQAGPRWAATVPFLVIAVYVTFGLIALVFAFLWTPAYVIIADTNLGFWEAMNLSRKLVVQRLGTWIVVYLAIFGIYLLGILALCVGVLFVMPMIYVMNAMIWDDIRRRGEEAMAWDASVPA